MDSLKDSDTWRNRIKNHGKADSTFVDEEGRIGLNIGPFLHGMILRLLPKHLDLTGRRRPFEAKNIHVLRRQYIQIEPELQLERRAQGDIDCRTFHGVHGRPFIATKLVS